MKPAHPVATAVVLAAGMGLRLGALGTRTPKGLLRLGSLPILEESLGKLLAVGVRRVVLVTGHLDSHYRELAARHPGTVELVHNPRFAQTGSLRSLACVGPVVDEDFLLLESDLVYERRALVECLRWPGDVLLVSGPTASRDEVWVEAADGRLVDMSKDRARLAGKVVGELVGITRVTAPMLRVLLGVEARLAAAAGHSRFHYETDGLVAATRERPVRVHLVPDLVWAEIDDEAHLARARESVYPAILAADGPPARP